MIIGKVWGTTEPLLVTPFIEIHRLNILPNRRCSMHCHKFKWNAFIVLSGELAIEVRKNAYDLVDRTDLGPGDMTTVRPNEKHRFVSGAAECVAYEIYYPEPLSEDIVRDDVGGLIATQG
jgi:mannose-6-phosphate isomerase-like protein (cupin superfamily)